MSREFLYRRLGFAVMVILAFFALAAPRSVAQGGRPQLKRPEDIPREKPPEEKKKMIKGPRAIGVLQLNGGKGTLVPIAILIDGRFYDASAYKADPVPMALESGTVYEAEQAGDSQGLFTIGGALHSKSAGILGPWLGTGSYLPNGTEAPKSTRKAEDVPVGLDNNSDSDAPPRLTRREAAKPAASNPSSASGPAAAEKPGGTAPSGPVSSQPASGSSSGTTSGQDSQKPPGATASEPAAQGGKGQATATGPVAAAQTSAGEAATMAAGERVTAIELVARNDAHRLVEECMVSANVAVAAELSRTNTPTLYRVHGKPEEQKLDRLLATLATLGIDAQIPKNVSTRDLQAITRRLGRAPERPFVESLVIRSLQQAVYQPTNIGHFGLALDHYAHFTSPIRRYPDLIVHRTLKALAGGGGGAAVRYDTAELSALGESTSKLEKRADEADRYVNNFLKCTFLRERIGQTFHGLITTVVDFGCFVQILEVAVDGLLHVDRLTDDSYEMDSDGHGWTGRRLGRRLRTGSQIKVVVTAVNPIEGLIDLELVEE